jgi:putative oxidoreductase
MNPMDVSSAALNQEIARTHLPMHRNPESARRELEAWDALRANERKETNELRSHVYLVGRLILASAFLIAAAYKLTHLDAAVGVIAGRGYSDASFLLVIALGTELVGGLMLAAGYQVRFVAAGLMGYLVAVSLLLYGDLSQEANRAVIFANLGFAAGLLLLAAHGAGSLSLEKYFARRTGARGPGVNG